MRQVRLPHHNHYHHEQPPQRASTLTRFDTNICTRPSAYAQRNFRSASEKYFSKFGQLMDEYNILVLQLNTQWAC